MGERVRWLCPSCGGSGMNTSSAPNVPCDTCRGYDPDAIAWPYVNGQNTAREHGWKYDHATCVDAVTDLADEVVMLWERIKQGDELYAKLVSEGFQKMWSERRVPPASSGPSSAPQPKEGEDE